MADVPASVRLPRLKRRPQFLRVAGGRRSAQAALVLQVRPQHADETGGPRIGFTVTKKVGNAVERNRVKRRLRAAADLLGGQARPGMDYVVVGRRETLTRRFTDVMSDLERAMRKLGAHAGTAP